MTKFVDIICPSKGRAKKVLTKNVLETFIIVVPQNEVDEYKEHNPELTVVGTPPEIKGIVPTRQWIIDNYPNCFMIDDDVKQVVRNFTGPGEKAKVTNKELVYEIIQNTAATAKALGVFLYGFASIRNPNEYRSHQPVKFSGYLNGSYSGVLEGHDLVYPTNWKEAEDYYISLLNAYKHRKSFIETRWSFHTSENFLAMGGCNDARTVDGMMWHTVELKKLFGDCVKPKFPTPNKKNVHKGERSITIPF